jgi:hypothetical protein
MQNIHLTYQKGRLAKCLLAFSLIVSFFMAVGPVGHSPIQLQKAPTEVVLADYTQRISRQISYQSQVFKPAFSNSLLPRFNAYHAVYYNQLVKVKLSRLLLRPISFSRTFQAFHLQTTTLNYPADPHSFFIG